jgi:type III restriction enzyme
MGKILLIETKGDHLDGSDSMQKLRLGRAWQKLAGNDYRYFMIFQTKIINEDCTYSLDEFIPILKQM